MSYIFQSNGYEDRVVEAMSGPKGCYVPVYSDDMDGDVLRSLVTSISEAVDRSIGHCHDRHSWLAIAFADYLHDRYKVEAVDCEFLTMFVTKLISAVGSSAYVTRGTCDPSACAILNRLSDYVDWNRYLAEHPEEEKGSVFDG